MLSSALLTCAIAFGPVAPAAHADPGSPSGPESCANRQAPPSADVPSEEPAPGESAPEPLPVPEEPVGGERMAECGVVLPDGAPDPPEEATASAWMVSDLESGDVLAASDPHGRHRPASLIKVLLAATVIDEVDPDEVVTATEEDVAQVCTCVGLVEGEDYTVEDLLTAALIHSGNDAAHALGNALGGIPEALDAMNTLAERLQAFDTRAATTSGLDGPGMSSSAYDLSVIFRYALGQAPFNEAVRTSTMDFSVEPDEEPVTLYNDNRLLNSYEGFLGGKTGYTNAARHTYLGAAQREHATVAVVLLHAEARPIPVPEQASALLDYGFDLAEGDYDAVGQLASVTRPESEPDVAVQEGAQPPHDDDATSASGAGSALGPVIATVVALLALLGIIALRRENKQVPRR
ncbi:D-alanyl-D-alanine carboxypeptidase (penicillin-binding protein 5/6) [Haloechinothrix alba]|uniref:D-alanyl-D-alanine carboxypeptidase (Penicillin-binding protein 5/6) n=1 Tax=Haloechinothrix alba TaxID=664784 RepID=A0A238VVX2_9PSEU|nr:D-alanyl-D-alanine carboxypeptidase (penicillin-binding protein 5/6) [Haloechinothrix alba]